MTVVTRQAMTDDSGTFTDGTVVNKAFVDQVYDQIDDQAHSTTNPTIKPKAITDEMVAARGSKASVDARLDVVLNEDGTLKTQAALVTTAQAGTFLASINVVSNGELEDWAGGGAAAPDNFSLTSLTVARTGPAMADTFTFGAGTYAAKLTRAGGVDGYMEQILIAAASWAAAEAIEGKKISVLMMAKSAIVSHVRITVDDGATTTSSNYHTGGGTAEVLTVTHTISASASKLHIQAEVRNSNGDAYVGGFMAVFSDVAPTNWVPLSTTPDATATRRGSVNTGAQIFAGVKSLKAEPLRLVGGDTTTYLPFGEADLLKSATPVTIPGSGAETTLFTTTLKGNQLSVNAGSYVRIHVTGTKLNNANSKTIRVKLGATTFITYTEANAGATHLWTLDLVLWRTTSANAQLIEGLGYSASGAGNGFVAFRATGAENLATDLALTITGASAAASADITGETCLIKVE